VFSLLQFLTAICFFQDQIPMPPVIKPVIDELRRMMEEMYHVLPRQNPRWSLQESS